MRARAALLSALTVACMASNGAADPVPSLDLRGFHPPTDPNSSVYLEPVVTPGPGNWNIGAWASYALSPVVLQDARGDTLSRVVHHQASIDYLASVGIGEKLALGLAIPTIVYQTGDNPGTLLPGSTNLPATTFGAPSASLKATVLSPSDLGGMGLAVMGRVFVPTDMRSYASDAAVRGEARLLSELNLLALSVRATAGFRARAKEETFLDNGTNEYRFGHDIPWGLGVTLRPQVLGIDREGHFRISIEGHGALAATPRFGSAAASPALIALSTRYTNKDLSVIAGVEAPLDSAVGNPMVRPIIGVGWAPRFLDADKDGIEDEADECPELEEDRDGFEDSDGCPDFDNDDDGVDDEHDKCPKEKEDADEFQDEDGCLDPDDDGDGVLDEKDACPKVSGPATGPKPGCPDPDPDKDHILTGRDKCPNEPEDRDGFQDADGCPDPDNDGDGVLDAADACPLEKGEAHAAPERNGCVNVDHDDDTFEDSVDKCPKEAEDFDGVLDTDGCPDEKGGAELLTLVDLPDAKGVSFKAPPVLVKDDVAPASLPTLRALGTLLISHPDWIALVGVRAAGATAKAEQAALNRAFAIVTTLRWLAHRDTAAEAVGFRAVEDAPRAKAVGLGVLVLVPRKPTDTTSAPKP